MKNFKTGKISDRVGGINKTRHEQFYSTRTITKYIICLLHISLVVNVAKRYSAKMMQHACWTKCKGITWGRGWESHVTSSRLRFNLADGHGAVVATSDQVQEANNECTWWMENFQNQYKLISNYQNFSFQPLLTFLKSLFFNRACSNYSCNYS